MQPATGRYVANVRRRRMVGELKIAFLHDRALLLHPDVDVPCSLVVT